MPRKKLILAATTDLTYDQRMQRAAQSLSDAGYDVVLLGRKKRSSKPLPGGFNFRAERLKCVFEKGKIFYIEFNIRLIFYLILRRFDALYCADLDTLGAGVVVKLLKGKPLIFDAHEYFTEVPELMGRQMTKYIWEMLERLTLPLTDLRFTVTQSLADIFYEKYNKNFYVVRNVPVYHADLPKEEHNHLLFFIYTGAVNYGRCIELLLQIFDNIPYKLVIAGDGDLLKEMKKLKSTCYARADVEFLGYVEPSKLRYLTRKAYAGFNVLNAESQSYQYSLANKFFDYVMAGIPQVCSRLPEYEKLNNEFEVAVLTDSSYDQVYNSVIQLVTDKHLYQKLKNNCQQASKIWNWDLEQRKMINLISENIFKNS